MAQLNDKNATPTTSGYRIVLILLGIAMTPILLSSSGLGSKLGGVELIKAVIIGGLILTVLSIMTLSIGQKARLPTYGIIKYPFGKKLDSQLMASLNTPLVKRGPLPSIY